MSQDIRNSISQDWITIILIGCLLLITFVKYRYPKKFDDFLLIVTSDKFLNTTISNSSLIHPFNFVLTLVQWVGFSLFIYIGYCYYLKKVVGEEITSFLYILLGFIAFEQLKLILERFIGHILNLSPLIQSLSLIHI